MVRRVLVAFGALPLLALPAGASGSSISLSVAPTVVMNGQVATVTVSGTADPAPPLYFGGPQGPSPDLSVYVDTDPSAATDGCNPDGLTIAVLNTTLDAPGPYKLTGSVSASQLSYAGYGAYPVCGDITDYGGSSPVDTNAVASIVYAAPKQPPPPKHRPPKKKRRPQRRRPPAPASPTQRAETAVSHELTAHYGIVAVQSDTCNRLTASRFKCYWSGLTQADVVNGNTSGHSGTAYVRYYSYGPDVQVTESP